MVKIQYGAFYTNQRESDSYFKYDTERVFWNKDKISRSLEYDVILYSIHIFPLCHYTCDYEASFQILFT